MSAICVATLLLSIVLVHAGELSQASPFDYLTKKYTLQDGRQVFVFDGVIPQEHLLSLNVFMSVNDHWRYVLPDVHSGINATMYDSGNGIPWKSWHDPANLMRTRVGSKLKNLVQVIDNNEYDGRSLNFEINEIYAGLIRRGDGTKLHQETTAGEKSYSIAIYNNVVWRKNAYGELLFYDAEGEVFASIRHKYGRVVVWDSSITYVFRPPSIAQLSTQGIILATFSADGTKNSQKLKHVQNFLQELRNAPNLNNWIGESPMSSSLDLDKHLTMFRKNRKGHFVAVFDGLFDDTSLSALRSWVIKYGTYFFDGSIDVESDNVQWIAGLNVDEFVNTQFWPVIKQISRYVTRNNTDWYPYDVACNLIRSHDHTRFHLDTSHTMEKEMTFLLYLSPNWTATDYGETAFMETNDDSTDNEYAAEVVPMYGRAVIFDGNFPHSARPPSVTHYDARYTFAVKLSYTKYEAVQKTFSEEFRQEGQLVGSVSWLSEINSNPKYSVSLHKIKAVAEHLNSRHLQKILSGQQDDSGDNDDELDSASVSGDSELDMIRASLPAAEQKLLHKMEAHYGVKNKPQPGVEQGNMYQTFSGLGPFESKVRQRSWKKWSKIAAGDPDKQNDYLQLYLKQRGWLKDYTAQKLIAML